jgi:glucosyl-3-phosphoglycerate synthase
MDNNWLKENTFHYSEFGDLSRLVEEKQKKKLKISLCLPTLNEEKTIAKEIIIMKSELMTRFPLVDELVVADVYDADEILPDLEKFKGKGENLWKALYITTGDIIVYIDADIKNIHHRFAFGLIGPLLRYDKIKYVKAFYDRPISIGKNRIRPTGGGRVTELVIRPLFSLFFPELTQVLQPLSGEYAGYREIFEKIPFPIGYGIETSMILDIYEKWGLEVMAQVDLDRRIHRNQDTKALGRMAFAILKTFINRQKSLGLVELKNQLFDEIIQYNLVENQYQPDILKIAGLERPPMIEIPEYCEKFNLNVN